MTDDLVPLAQILNRHNFKENKFKCRALSGRAQPWLENLREGFVAGELRARAKLNEKGLLHTPLHIEAKSGKDIFFVRFGDHFNDRLGELEGQYVYVARDSFPALASQKDVYLCDLIGQRVQTPRGIFVVKNFFENSTAVAAVSSISLVLTAANGIEVEVPLRALQGANQGAEQGADHDAEKSWLVPDIDLWLEASRNEPGSADDSE